MHIGSGVDTSAMIRVQAGMRIADAAGDDLGKVEYLQMGNPEAVTTEGNEHRPVDLVGAVVERALPKERLLELHVVHVVRHPPKNPERAQEPRRLPGLSLKTG